MGDPYKNLNWDDFRLLKAVADSRGLPGAAARLGLNHSTVFRRLAQIEAAIGSKLFERHRSGYALTVAGEEMAGVAERLDRDITAFTRKIAGQEISPAGELRVTTNDTLLVDLLTPLFAQFRERFPKVRLDVVVSNQSLNLSKRDADVAIRATDTPPETLVGRRVAEIGWALYGRADAASMTSPTKGEESWVTLGDNMATIKAVRFVHQNVPPERIVYRLNTVLGLAEAVEAGIGIGHLPCFIGDRRPGLLRLAEPERDFASNLWLLTHPDLRHSARVRALLDFLAGEIGKLRPLLAGSTPPAVSPAPV